MECKFIVWQIRGRAVGVSGAGVGRRKWHRQLCRVPSGALVGFGLLPVLVTRLLLGVCFRVCAKVCSLTATAKSIRANRLRWREPAPMPGTNRNKHDFNPKKNNVPKYFQNYSTVILQHFPNRTTGTSFVGFRFFPSLAWFRAARQPRPRQLVKLYPFFWAGTFSHCNNPIGPRTAPVYARRARLLSLRMTPFRAKTNAKYTKYKALHPRSTRVAGKKFFFRHLPPPLPSDGEICKQILRCIVMSLCRRCRRVRSFQNGPVLLT